MKIQHRKTVIVLIASCLIFISGQESLTASQISKAQAQRAINGIKSEIIKVTEEKARLNSNKRKSLDEAFASAQLETRKIQEVFELKKKEQVDKKAVEQARLNDLRVFKVTVDNISACGTNFQTRCEKDQIIKVPTSASVDIDFLIKLGGFVPLDELAYQKAVKNIKDIDAEILKLDSNLPSDKTSIENRYKAEVDRIYDDFENQIFEKDSLLSLLKMSRKAAERAIKSPNSYQDAFNSAILFEINLENISDIADTSFENIESLLDLSLVRNAVDLSEQGESISASYSNLKAKKYNKIFGKTFIDDYYKQIITKTSGIYKKFAK